VRATSTREDTPSLWKRFAHVALDGLHAEEQLGCDLGVGLAVDDEPGHLELALGQQTDAIPLARAGRRPGSAPR
jgi:hypothetical protein